MVKVMPFNDAIYEDKSIGIEFRKRQLDIKNSKESFLRKLKLSIKMFKTNKKVFKRFKREKEDENFAKKKAQIAGKKLESKIKKEIKSENDRVANKIKKKYRKFKGFKKSSIIGYGVKKRDYKNNKKEKINFKELEAPFFPDPWLPSNPPGWVIDEGLPKVEKLSTAEESERWLYFHNLDWEYKLYKQEIRRALTLSVRDAFLKKIPEGEAKIVRQGKLSFKNLLSLDLEHFY